MKRGFFAVIILAAVFAVFFACRNGNYDEDVPQHGDGTLENPFNHWNGLTMRVIEGSVTHLDLRLAVASMEKRDFGFNFHDFFIAEYVDGQWQEPVRSGAGFQPRYMVGRRWGLSLIMEGRIEWHMGRLTHVGLPPGQYRLIMRFEEHDLNDLRPPWEQDRPRAYLYVPFTIYETKALSNWHGLEIQVAQNSLRDTGLQLNIINSSEDQHFAYNPIFRHEKYIDGVWHRVPYGDRQYWRPGESNVRERWLGPPLLIPPGYAQTMGQHWAEGYGVLPPGQYRLIKSVEKWDVYDTTPHHQQNRPSAYLYALFAVHEAIRGDGTRENPFSHWNGLEIRVAEDGLRPTGLRLHIVNPDAGREFVYVNSFYIEEYMGGSWQQIPFRHLSPTWEAANFVILPGHTQETDKDWRAFHGTLSVGQYRIVKPFSEGGQTIYLYASFAFDAYPNGGLHLSVPEGSVTPSSLRLVMENNNPRLYFSYGVFLSIEEYFDDLGIWRQVPFINDVGWILPGFLVSPGFVVEENIAWDFMHGELPPGKYRVVRSFAEHDLATGRPGPQTNHYAAFIIREDWQETHDAWLDQQNLIVAAAFARFKGLDLEILDYSTRGISFNLINNNPQYSYIVSSIHIGWHDISLEEGFVGGIIYGIFSRFDEASRWTTPTWAFGNEVRLQPGDGLSFTVDWNETLGDITNESNMNWWRKQSPLPNLFQLNVSISLDVDETYISEHLRRVIPGVPNTSFQISAGFGISP